MPNLVKYLAAVLRWAKTKQISEGYSAKTSLGCLRSPSRVFSVFALTLEKTEAGWITNGCTGLAGSACLNASTSVVPRCLLPALLYPLLCQPSSWGPRWNMSQCLCRILPRYARCHTVLFSSPKRQLILK